MPDWSRLAQRIRVPLGFAFAAFYIWVARPTWLSIALGTAIAIPGLTDGASDMNISWDLYDGTNARLTQFGRNAA